MTYIALQPATEAALDAITAPKGVRALLPNGAQYVQADAPTGDNWILENGQRPGSFVRATTHNSHATHGSYERV